MTLITIITYILLLTYFDDSFQIPPKERDPELLARYKNRIKAKNIKRRGDDSTIYHHVSDEAIAKEENFNIGKKISAGFVHPNKTVVKMPGKKIHFSKEYFKALREGKKIKELKDLTFKSNEHQPSTSGTRDTENEASISGTSNIKFMGGELLIEGFSLEALKALGIEEFDPRIKDEVEKEERKLAAEAAKKAKTAKDKGKKKSSK